MTTNIRPDGGLISCWDRDCGVYGLCPECRTQKDRREST